MTEDYKDKETLERLYWDEGMTMKEMGEVCCCSSKTINNWMDKFEIPVRTPGTRLKPYHDKELLRELYHDKGMTIDEIADKFDVTYAAIRKRMIKYGIGRRTRSEHKLKTPPSHYWHNGYEKISSTINGKRSLIRVHQLIAIAEYGFDEVVGKEIHHKNEVKWDNRPENLEVMTKEEHSRHHATKNNRLPQP